MLSLKQNKFFRFLLRSAIILFAISAVALFYSTLIEPNLLVINKIEIPSKKLNKDTKIIILSDIHAPISNTLFKKIVKGINNFSPDFILIPGDINAHLIPKDPSIEFLNKLSSETGKKIILIFGDSDICSANGQCIYCKSKYNQNKVKINATILRDSIITPLPNLYISGIDHSNDDNWHLKNFYDSIPDSSFKLLLLHNTVGIKNNYFSNYDLSISGNTHGGQVMYSAYITSKFDDELDGRYIKGLYDINGKSLIVSSGIGMSFLPIRFGVPPELITLTLKGEKNE